jgi:hypothetical protein
MKITVIGNDINALMAAYVARQQGHTVTLFSFKELDLRSPYVVFESKLLCEILYRLGITFSSYRIKSGILMMGSVHPFPRVFREIGKARSLRVRSDLYAKTRLVAASEVTSQAIDIEVAGTKIGLHFGWPEFIDAITRSLQSTVKPILSLKSDRILFQDGAELPFDLCFVSLPLWKCQPLVDWHLPHACAVAMNTAKVDQNTHPDIRDQMAGWDSVWTPYTPDSLIHRVFQVDGGYHVQFSGKWPAEEPNPALLGDLNYLFPAGWAATGSLRGEAGFLCPLSEKPSWPKSVRPIGRLARWDARATMTQTIEDVAKAVK